MSDSKDAALIVAITRELNLALDFLQGTSLEEFEHDVMRQHAVAMAVAQTGEYVKKLSSDFRSGAPEIEWKAMAGIRDWIVHNYEGLDFEEIYDSVTQQAPDVLQYLQPLVQSLQQEHPLSSADGIDDFLSDSEAV